MNQVQQAKADLSNPALQIPKGPGPRESKAARLLNSWLDSTEISDFSCLPPSLGPALAKCTRKQQRFAGYVALGWPQVVAYKHVYDAANDCSEKSLLVQASDVAKNSKVADLISEISVWLAKKWTKDGLQVRDWALCKLADEADYAEKGSERISATKLILQMHGQLVQRSEVIHRSGSDVDRQDELARQLLDCIQSTLQSTQDYQPAQLTSGSQLCSRCQAEIDPVPASEE